MKGFKLLHFFFVILLISPFLACDDSAKGKSLILVPGWGASDAFLGDQIDYFWKLKEPLEDEGFIVYEAPVPGFATTANRAKHLAAYIYLISRKAIIDNKISNPEEYKFNLICHSHGGLVARYLIRALNIPDPRYDIPGIDIKKIY